MQHPVGGAAQEGVRAREREGRGAIADADADADADAGAGGVDILARRCDGGSFPSC